MDKFAFIFHPLDLSLYADGFNEHHLKKMKPSLVEGVMKWLPPFKRETITGIKSLTGDEIEGDMILVSLLPEQILSLDNNFVLNRIIEAGKIAEQSGAKIVGLGAYAAQVGKKGVLIAKSLKIPVTTGSSYTVSVAVEAILKAAAMVGIKLVNAKIVIIGATGSVGSICSKLLVAQGAHVVIVARNYSRLTELKNEMLADIPDAAIEIDGDINNAIRDADIIITSTSTPLDLIEVKALNPGTIICDISRPKNISRESLHNRDDILVIEGGVVKPPGNVDFHFSFGLPFGLAYACIAETMILTLEKRYENYSIGGNVSVEKAEEMGRLAKKHGFKLAKLMSFDRQISNGQIEKVKEARSIFKN